MKAYQFLFCQCVHPWFHNQIINIVYMKLQCYNPNLIKAPEDVHKF